MAKNVTLRWVLPTVRESGFPLAAADISHSTLLMSADQGQNFVEVNEVDGDAEQVLVINDVDPGTWYFRVVVVDTQGRAGLPADIQATIDDDTAPGVATSLSVELS